VVCSGKNKVRRPRITPPSSRKLSGKWGFCALLNTKENHEEADPEDENE